MSLDVSVWVWKHADASGARLLVLLALADIADHDGLCWPSVPTLAQRTRLHEQTVRGHLNELREAGAIETVAVPGRSNRYRVLMVTPTNIATPSDSRTPTKASEGTPTNPLEGTPTNPLETNSHNSHEQSSEFDGGDLPEGTRSPQGFPKPFTVTREMREWAGRKAPSIGVDEVTSEFVAYWRVGEGSGKRRKNWALTWQTWLTRAHKRNVERGWVAPVVVQPVLTAVPGWVQELRIPAEEYLERRGEVGWVESMERLAAKRTAS